MKAETQLLCTFCAKKDIDATIAHIKKVYSLAFNSVYVLDNVNDESQVILTYNIDLSKPRTEFEDHTNIYMLSLILIA